MAPAQSAPPPGAPSAPAVRGESLFVSSRHRGLAQSALLPAAAIAPTLIAQSVSTAVSHAGAASATLPSDLPQCPCHSQLEKCHAENQNHQNPPDRRRIAEISRLPAALPQVHHDGQP